MRFIEYILIPFLALVNSFTRMYLDLKRQLPGALALQTDPTNGSA
jgi:hypothetical protein